MPKLGNSSASQQSLVRRAVYVQKDTDAVWLARLIYANVGGFHMPLIRSPARGSGIVLAIAGAFYPWGIDVGEIWPVEDC